MVRTRKASQQEEDATATYAQDTAVDPRGSPGPGSVAEPQEPPAVDATAGTRPSMQLDDFSKWPDLLHSLGKLQGLIADPTVFLQPNANVTSAARAAVKDLHAYMTAAAAKATTLVDGSNQGAAASQPSSSSSSLHVGPDFDAEQVWLQLELLTGPLLRHCRKRVTQLQQEPPESLVPPDVDADVDLLFVKLPPPPGMERNRHEVEGGSDEGEEEEEDEVFSEEDEEEDEEEGSEGEEEQQQQQQQQQQQKKKGGRRLPTETRFFKLSDMEAFVEQAEREAAGLEDGDEEEEEEDEEEDDEDLDEEDMEEGKGEGEGIPGAGRHSRRKHTAEEDDDEEQRLAALLDDAAAMVGQKRSSGPQQKQGSKRRRQELGSDSDAEDGGAAGDVMYSDFFGDEEEDEDGEEQEGSQPGSSEEEDADQQQLQQQRGKGKKAAAAAGKQRHGLLDSDEDDGGDEGQLSTHEKRLLRMQERVRELEEENFGEKPWHLAGEAAASRRPLNSALEMDLDFETTTKPPPAPTEEATTGLEEMIKQRIREQRWDDVVRQLPPPVEKKKKVVELDDSKATQGLAEVYEADYVRAAAAAGGATGAAGLVADKQEPLRREVRALFSALCAKLDALSAFHYAPKPLVEELEVRSEVPALLMEEVAPLAVSTAAMQTPAEVYNPQAHGEVKAEQELTREERKRRRSKKKRTHKAQAAADEAAAAQKAAAAGGAAAVAGRKSLQAQLAAAKSSGLIQSGIKPGQKHGRGDFGKSTAVFAKIQESRDAAAAGKKPGKPKADMAAVSGNALKL